MVFLYVTGVTAQIEHTLLELNFFQFCRAFFGALVSGFAGCFFIVSMTMSAHAAELRHGPPFSCGAALAFHDVADPNSHPTDQFSKLLRFLISERTAFQPEALDFIERSSTPINPASYVDNSLSYSERTAAKRAFELLLAKGQNLDWQRIIEELRRERLSNDQKVERRKTAERVTEFIPTIEHEYKDLGLRSVKFGPTKNRSEGPFIVYQRDESEGAKVLHLYSGTMKGLLRTLGKFMSAFETSSGRLLYVFAYGINSKSEKLFIKDAFTDDLLGEIPYVFNFKSLVPPEFHLFEGPTGEIFLVTEQGSGLVGAHGQDYYLSTFNLSGKKISSISVLSNRGSPRLSRLSDGRVLALDHHKEGARIVVLDILASGEIVFDQLAPHGNLVNPLIFENLLNAPYVAGFSNNGKSDIIVTLNLKTGAFDEIPVHGYAFQNLEFVGQHRLPDGSMTFLVKQSEPKPFRYFMINSAEKKIKPLPSVDENYRYIWGEFIERRSGAKQLFGLRGDLNAAHGAPFAPVLYDISIDKIINKSKTFPIVQNERWLLHESPDGSLEIFAGWNSLRRIQIKEIRTK
jgi:hypothetical protein